MTLLPNALVVTLIAALPLAAPAGAQSEIPDADGVVSTELVGGWREEGGVRVAALRIELSPGWHTYWRIPGDVGIPPSFDWSGSSNLAAVDYIWPRPTIFDADGFRFYGYTDELVLPVRLSPVDPEAPIDVDLRVFFGVCKSVCLPAETVLSGPRADLAETPEGTRAIKAALSHRAQTASEAGISRVTCDFVPDGVALDLVADVTFASGTAPQAVALVESNDPSLWFGPMDSTADGARLIARTRVLSATPDNARLERDTLRLSLLGDGRMIEIPHCPQRG
jgi:DsbC/DsbD-like thiol-disulfide interchange protein